MDEGWTPTLRRGGTGRAGDLAAAILPGLFLLGLSFRAGGFFAGSTALAVVLGLLGVLLALQLMARPFSGVGAAALVPIGALTLLAVWALVSGDWSGSTARGLTESDRYLLYALLVALGACAPRGPGRLRLAVTGVAAAIVLVCAAGVVTRALPQALPTDPGASPDRLSFPLSYWNGMGILATAGVLLCLGLSGSPQSRRAVRLIAAAAVPLVAVTLYLSLARGAIAALAIGLVALVLAGRLRELVGTAVAVAAPTAVAVVVAYRQDALTSLHPASATAVAQGHHLLWIVLGCVVAAALLRLAVEPLERRLLAWRPARTPARRTRYGLYAGAVVLAAAAALALGAPHAIRDGAKRFADSSATTTGRSRLTEVRNNGRLDHWRVALDTFSAHPLKGTGAGTYAIQWAIHRPSTLDVLHAHSAYLGVLSDLGLVGGLLLVVAVVALVAGLAARARGPDRLVVAGAFAAALAWALHAGIDWDLEMPATGAWVFMLGGMALARSAPVPAGRRMGGALRLAGGVAALVVAATPALVAISQVRIGRSAADFQAGDCRGAVSQAVSAANTLGLRPEPYEILGFCDTQLGSTRLGVRMMGRAVTRDPDWWEYRYGLALVRGAAGLDPRPAAATARRLNPHNPLVRDLEHALRTARTPAAWRRVALRAQLPES